eukprot:1991714-Rhodomonas_salina.2
MHTPQYAPCTPPVRPTDRAHGALPRPGQTRSLRGTGAYSAERFVRVPSYLATAFPVLRTCMVLWQAAVFPREGHGHGPIKYERKLGPSYRARWPQKAYPHRAAIPAAVRA